MIPLLVANITTGALSDSKARFKKEKHSISNMWTSSINSTPGTTSAFPSSFHSATFPSIYSLISASISPVSPLKRSKNPFCLELITSISCNVTVWTTSFLFSISPSGHYTNLVYGPKASNSEALAKDLPNLLILPDTLSIVITSPAVIFSFVMDSIILAPKSYTVSISVVLRVILPVLAPEANILLWFYLLIYQFLFLLLLLLLFRFLLWFLHQWIYERLGWGIRFWTFEDWIFLNQPWLWREYHFLMLWQYPWQWRFCQFLVGRQWECSDLLFCRLVWCWVWYQQPFWHFSRIWKHFTCPTIPWEICLGSKPSSRPRPLMWD